MTDYCLAEAYKRECERDGALGYISLPPSWLDIKPWIINTTFNVQTERPDFLERSPSSELSLVKTAHSTAGRPLSTFQVLGTKEVKCPTGCFRTGPTFPLVEP